MWFNPVSVGSIGCVGQGSCMTYVRIILIIKQKEILFDRIFLYTQIPHNERFDIVETLKWLGSAFPVRCRPQSGIVPRLLVSVLHPSLSASTAGKSKLLSFTICNQKSLTQNEFGTLVLV